MQTLAPRLNPHGEARQPALKTHFIGYHALERGDVAGLGCDAVTIHIETDRAIEAGGGPQAAVEEQPLGRVNRQMHARRFDNYFVPQFAERAGQHRDPHVSSAAAANVERRAGEETDAHGGACFSLPVN